MNIPLERTLLFIDANIPHLISLLNSDFTIAALGSAFGAFGAAFALWRIEQSKKKEKTLCQLNAAIAQCIGIITDLMNLKSQRVLPSNIEIDKNIENINNGIRTVSFKESSLHISHSAYKYDLPIQFFSNHTNIAPDAFLLSIKFGQSLDQVSSIIEFKNNIIDEIQKDLSTPDERIKKTLGIEVDGKRDNRFVSANRGLQESVDYALFFGRLCIKKLIKVGIQNTPKKMHKHIITFEVLDSFKDLLPPEDLIENWDT